jgi:hypothetical protein
MVLIMMRTGGEKKGLANQVYANADTEALPRLIRGVNSGSKRDP